VEPEGSQIVIDGEIIGQTPSVIRLLPGIYRVEINNQDKWIPLVNEYVYVTRDKTETLTGALEQKTGTLGVISTPLGAHINIDGKDYGVTPNSFQFPIGSYKLKLSKEGFCDYEETVNVEWREIVERSIEMVQEDIPINTALDLSQKLPIEEQKVETSQASVKPEMINPLANRKDINHIGNRLKLTSLSLVVPGLGQYMGKRYISGTIFLLMGLGTAVGTAIGYLQYDRAVEDYDQAIKHYHDAVIEDAVIETEQKMVEAHDDAERKFLFRQAGFIATGSIWALNVLHILIAGASDSYTLQQTDSLGWNISPQVTPNTVALSAWSRF
jgi:hypothetical protein